jgi:hypothetical protein
MRRLKVIKQTMEWYDIPDDVVLDMEKLTKDYHSKISNLISINIISDDKIDEEFTPSDITEMKEDECSEKLLPQSE